MNHGQIQSTLQSTYTVSRLELMCSCSGCGTVSPTKECDWHCHVYFQSIYWQQDRHWIHTVDRQYISILHICCQQSDSHLQWHYISTENNLADFAPWLVHASCYLSGHKHQGGTQKHWSVHQFSLNHKVLRSYLLEDLQLSMGFARDTGGNKQVNSETAEVLYCTNVYSPGKCLPTGQQDGWPAAH